MWIIFALLSAFCLGFYDIFKKISVRDNNVPLVLLLNTLFGTLLLSPVIVAGLAHGDFGFGNSAAGHLRIVLKACIVLSSWIMGYFAIKHLPLTIQGPINASRPVMVLLGALLIFGEKLNWMQWTGMIIGFSSLFLISRIGAKEGFSLKRSKWLWLSIGATVLGAVSALYDKYLLGLYRPFEVQAWYTLYQFVIMFFIVMVLRRLPHGNASGKFHWRWSILGIPVFLTVADLAYFYSLSYADSMISITSMIRRGSVIIPFLYGVIVLHERNVRQKAVDLCILFLSLALLVIGSR